jgi:hypothetical protein
MVIKTYQVVSSKIFDEEPDRPTYVRGIVRKERLFMNQPVREIYADYRYELMKLNLELDEISLADAASNPDIDTLIQKGERLEALVDLYAYILACQGHGQLL